MNSDLLSAPESISLATRFHTGAISFSEREKGLDRAQQIRESNVRQQFAERQAEIERRHRRSVDARHDDSAVACAAFEELCRKRRVRLDRAQIAVRNQVISALQASEGQRRAALQREFMEAGRRREQTLAEAHAEHETSTEAWKANQVRFQRLERAAVSSLRGYGKLQRRILVALKDAELPSATDLAKPPSEEGLSAAYAELSDAVKSLRSSPFVRWFAAFPVALQIFLIVAAGASLPLAAQVFPNIPLTWPLALGAAGVVAGLLGAAWLIGRRDAARFVEVQAPRFAEAKSMRLHQQESLEWNFNLAVEHAEGAYRKVKSSFEQGLKEKAEAIKSPRYLHPEAVETRAAALRERLERHCQYRLDTIHQTLADHVAEAEKKRDEDLVRLEDEMQPPDDPGEAIDRLANAWEHEILPLANQLSGETLAAERARDFAWLASGPEEWSPPASPRNTLAFGELVYSGQRSELKLPLSPFLGLPISPEFRLPLRLRIPDAASLLLETKQSGRAEAIGLLNLLALGWLASTPPGRLSFSLFDPVGLGESFAGLMHLADYEDLLINTRIRTQPDQIERRLGELCEHMEKVIQMYLRTDYATITDYNEAAGTIAERYHFVVVADFPHGFSELAARRLASIAASGARCGVFLLIHHDARAELPQGFRIEDLRKACLTLQSGPEGFHLMDPPVRGLSLSLASPPPPETFARWSHRLGAANRDTNRIEVPFSFIAPGPEELWSSRTAEELRVPIGRSGATKMQYLALGKGTCQHALIAGKTGSGKSTLFHIIVSNLSLWCSPDEVEFYLIDFKKGVEFKCYADHALPHARVIAIESDREFGLSVLERLDEELRRRGELFRAAGTQDLASYRAKGDAPRMPRTLLLIDEFQEFFTEDDAISQQAAVLLDRIVRQGRAFGIHAVLGSQTLGGAFTLARATLGQMTVRIALACNEADAYLIMDDANPAPRLLTRPGEGIYNDRAGAAEANSPFQVVWLGEGERDEILAQVAAKDRTTGGDPRPLVVFEGNAPAEVASDKVLHDLLKAGPQAGPPRIFLGAPNSIKGPTEVRFLRQSGNHLLVVGQREDAVDAFILVALRMLRAQFGGDVRLVLVDGRFTSPDDSPFRRAVECVGGIECPDAHQVGPLLNELASDLKAVSQGEKPDGGKPVFLFLPSLHRHRKLRHEEDFSFSLDTEAEVKPSDSLQHLILEGPPWGFHLFASIDSYNNLVRTLGRKAAGEFERKVLFQMSAADSASLIDSGKASELGLNRALLHDESAGTIEIFRPYAPPARDWFD